MWTPYRKSPLGVVVREYMASIVDVCVDSETLHYEAKLMSEIMSGRLAVLDLQRTEDLLMALSLDPDLGDVVKECDQGKKFALAVSWA